MVRSKANPPPPSKESLKVYSSQQAGRPAPTGSNRKKREMDQRKERDAMMRGKNVVNEGDESGSSDTEEEEEDPGNLVMKNIMDKEKYIVGSLRNDESSSSEDEEAGNDDIEADHDDDDDENQSEEELNRALVLSRYYIRDETAGTCSQEGQKSKKRSKKPSTRKNIRNKDDRSLLGIAEEAPFPGGPIVGDVLPQFYQHVALRVWIGNERGALRLKNHARSLRQWRHCMNSDAFSTKVARSGLTFLKMVPEKLDKSLISAFVERWHPETSSFHLPFGEMTITLDDVHELTGLNIGGHVLTEGFALSVEDGIRLVHKCLGFDEAEIKKEFASNTGACNMKLGWLQNKLDTIFVLDEFTRGYLLYSIGAVLCPDKSGNLVSAGYLRYLENLEEVDNVAWGAIALAFLYNQLNYSSRGDVVTIAGFLALLEAWILELFYGVFPRALDRKWVVGIERMLRWTRCAGVVDANSCTIQARETLDKLMENEVIWNPYDIPDRRVPDVTFYEGSLQCLAIKVPHLPNRVLRQFGLVQMIPSQIVNVHGAYFSQWQNHVVDLRNRRPIVPDRPTAVEGYLDWFLQRTHPRVQNPDRHQGPQLTGFTGQMSKGVDVGKIHYCIKLLGNAMEGGRKACGKVWPTLTKVHQTLLSCGAGAPPDDDEEQNEEDRDSPPVPLQRKKRKSKNLGAKR